MSSTIRVRNIKVTDAEALQAAIDANPDVELIAAGSRRRTLAPVATVEEARGTHVLYSGDVNGIGIRLKGWNYPAAINLETGEISYDNYHGQWGAMDIMDGFVQSYVVEKTRLEAMAQNIQMANEETLDDGTVELTFSVFDS
jgi:hypothetical protein